MIRSSVYLQNSETFDQWMAFQMDLPLGTQAWPQTASLQSVVEEVVFASFAGALAASC